MILNLIVLFKSSFLKDVFVNISKLKKNLTTVKRIKHEFYLRVLNFDLKNLIAFIL